MFMLKKIVECYQVLCCEEVIILGLSSLDRVLLWECLVKLRGQWSVKRSCRKKRINSTLKIEQYRYLEV